MAGEHGVLAPDNDSLFGLEPGHRNGLIGVAVVAAVSLATSTALFFHLTFKLVRWHIRDRRVRRAEVRRLTAHSPGVDLSLGLAPRHFRGGGGVMADDAEDPRSHSGGGTRPGQAAAEGEKRGKKRPEGREPNQFVVLLYNLLLADIHQSMAFFLNVVWVGGDGIFVGTTTCWAQGWFVSTGDLAASLFITAIAVHTYLVAIRGWKPSQMAIIVTCVLIWVFDYLMVVVGVAATRHGASGGGFYVRAVAWCWVNEEYENIRLLTHYLFIFIALALTSIIYTAIFLNLRRRRRRESPASSIDAKHGGETTTTPSTAPTTNTAYGYNSAFLVYPMIYVVCTSPLAIGRIVTMAGVRVPIGYFCMAGAMISCNGFLDTLLWGSTRRDVVFGDVDESDALGLDTFTFMRTPHGRKYGNMVWVEGAGSNGKNDRGGTELEDTGGGRSSSFWQRIFSGRSGSGSGGGAGDGGVDLSTTGRGQKRRPGRTRGERSLSQEALRGGAFPGGRADTLAGGIQMDMVTTVVVEVDPDAKDGGRVGGLAVSPEDFIARMPAHAMCDDGRLRYGEESSPRKGGGTRTRDPSSSRYSTQGSELELNFDILNRL